MHTGATGPGGMASEPHASTQWETVQKAEAQPRHGKDWSLSLFVLQVQRGSSDLLHTGANLRTGRGTAGGAGAATEDPALSPQTARGGEEGCWEAEKHTWHWARGGNSAVGHVMEAHLLHSASFAATCGCGG